jgi:5,10-methylenetetrahydromethanopterin reductase
MTAQATTAGVPDIGVVVRDPLPWDQVRQVVGTAEETGYRAVFVPEITGREAFATLAGLSGAAPTLRLGTGVVTMWSRGPATTAMAAATVHDLSGGRMVLGLGAGIPPEASPEGSPEALASWGGPLGRLRAYTRVVRGILCGRPAPEGDRFGAGGFASVLEPPEPPPPIWLAALGDRAVALAGEVADGVLLNWCTPQRVVAARRAVRQAAERAGRDPAEVSVAVYVRACLGVEEAVAMLALKEATAQYAALPRYRRQMHAMGLGSEADAAAAAHRAGRPDQVPERLVRALTVSGGRREALDRFAAFREAGADLVLCYPVPALDRLSSLLGTVIAAAPAPAGDR